MILERVVYDGAQAIAVMDVAQLEKIVCQAVAMPVTVTTWQVTLLGGLDSSPMAGGVYKVTGTAVTPANITCEWCVVAKILRSPEGFTMPDGTLISREMAEAPDHFGYWRRELLAAESELLDQLPAGLCSPRTLGVTNISEQECWLWQECLPEDHEWTWVDYREAAFRLGRWQGTTASQFPDAPWLSKNWLADWVHGPLIGIFSMIEKMDGHPLLRDCFTPEELAAVRCLWADRQGILKRLEKSPQTLCHLDAHRGNLSWQDDDLALFDWAFVGAGAMGEELAAFIGATLLLDYVPLNDAELLEQTAFDGYVAGLHAAGWSGDVSLIWEAYRCVMPLRFALPSLASMLLTALQPGFAADWERRMGKSLVDILAHRAGLVRFYLSRQPDVEEFIQC
jgi:hypothetical protein